jgi:hypothetical protein
MKNSMRNRVTQWVRLGLLGLGLVFVAPALAQNAVVIRDKTTGNVASVSAAGALSVNVGGLSNNLTGSETFVGTLTATAASPVDEANTPVPFTVLVNTCYRIQCAAAVYYIPYVLHGSFADTKAIQIQANANKDTCLYTATPHMAIDPVSGTTSCKVFSVQ